MTEMQDIVKAGEQTRRNWTRAGWKQTIIYTVVLIVLAALLPQAGLAQPITDYAMLAACTGAIIAVINQNAAAFGATLAGDATAETSIKAMASDVADAVDVFVKSGTVNTVVATPDTLTGTGVGAVT